MTDWVRLSPADVARADKIASLRFSPGRLQPAFGWEGTDAQRYAIDQLGCYGELAFCIAIGKPWPATVDTFRVADCYGAEVRCRSQAHYDLIVRPSDFNGKCDWFVLTYGGEAPWIEVVGKIHRNDVQRPGWWKAYGGRPGAWFVPRDALKPLDLKHREGAVA